MSHFKGQSGVEYLTMYAAAFMILLVVIAGVYYVMGYWKIVTPHCDFPLDLQCVDYVINGTGNLTLILRQNTGHPIIITEFNCTSNDNIAGITSPLPTPVSINSGMEQLVINGTPCYLASGGVAIGSSGNYYTGKLFVKYNESDTGFGHVLTGNIVAKYE
jgi:hypothetical protein